MMHTLRSVVLPLLEGFSLFLGVWIILSLWAGYAGLLTPVVGLVSLLVTFELLKKFPHEETNVPALPHAGMAFLFIVLCMGIVFFGLQGGFDLSADATPSVATLILTNQIPSTYLPYFNLPLFYQMGLPVIAHQLAGLGIPIHTALWGFSLIGIALLLTGLMLVGKHIGLSSISVEWIPLVFLTTRLPFYNVLLGEYPWMLAAGLGLMAIHLLQQKSKLGFLLLGAAAVTHPYIGFLNGVAWVLLFRPAWKNILYTIGGVALIALPVFVFLFLPFSGLEKIPLAPTALPTLNGLIGNIFLVGIIPTLFSLAFGIIALYRRERLTHAEQTLLLIGIGGLIVAVFLNAFIPDLIIGTKLPAFSLIGVVLLGSHFFGKMVPSKRFRAGAAVLLVTGMLILGTSTSMESYAKGSKSNLEEAQFAQWLSTYDTRIVPVLFLSDGIGKMAQYSRKIPADPRGAHFMLTLQFLQTPGAKKLYQQSDDYRALQATRCVSCVPDFLEKYPMTYVVVNITQYPPLENAHEISRRGNFILYEGNLHYLKD
ncbi:MAG: hypothetical protein V1776_00685 [Candidatus Diapherotrites archaeon]